MTDYYNDNLTTVIIKKTITPFSCYLNSTDSLSFAVVQVVDTFFVALAEY